CAKGSFLLDYCSRGCLPDIKQTIIGGVSNVDIDGNNALQIKAIGVVISTFETLSFSVPPLPTASASHHFCNLSERRDALSSLRSAHAALSCGMGLFKVVRGKKWRNMDNCFCLML